MRCRIGNISRKLLFNTYSTVTIRRKMSTPTMILYGDDASPPVRFVRMTAALLDIKLDYHVVDVFKDENKSEFFKKINPLQKIPALSIGDQVIRDSHAIALYLCDRNSGLYPDNAMTRASINEMMFYNATTLFRMDSFIFSAHFARKPVNEDKINEWKKALDYLEYKLKGRNWLAGNQMYLCDLCLITTVTSMQELVPVTERHSRVLEWIQRFEELPCFEINKKGIERLRYYMEKFVNTK